MPTSVDDSYIYLRIAANIGHGAGWVYNAGEVGNAATSTLHTLLLTAVGLVVGYSDRALALSYGLSMFVLATIQYVAWRREGRAVAVTMALITTFSARALDSFGMETTLLLACASAAALAYRARGDSWLAGVLCGLTALSRPEGLAVLGLVGVVELIRNRRVAWHSIAGTSLLVLPWLLFATWYFGTPVSHAAVVKAAQRHQAGGRNNLISSSCSCGNRALRG